MKNNHNDKSMREPFVRMAKRDTMPWYNAWAVRGGAIVIALLVAGVATILLTGKNPIQIYSTIFFIGYVCIVNYFCSFFSDISVMPRFICISRYKFFAFLITFNKPKFVCMIFKPFIFYPCAFI